MSKGKRNRDLESVADCQMERKKFCPNKETLTTSLKGKLTVLFKEDAQFKQDYLKRSLNWTEESAVHETGMQLQSQRMGLYQANQLIDRAPKGKELAM